jgi:spore coat protein U-like protein
VNKQTPFIEGTGTVRTLLLALACTLGASPLYADALCTVDPATLNFPPYDVFNPAATRSTGMVTVRCLGTNGSTSAMVALQIGAGANGTVTDRRMAGNGSVLRYGLYSDSNYSQNWGDGAGAPTRTVAPLDTELPTPAIFTLYGSIPPMQDANPGSYSDTLLITVTP